MSTKPQRQAFGVGKLAELEKLPQTPPSPASTACLVDAAIAAMGKDQPAEAESYLVRALHAQPDSPILWNNLGIARREQNLIAAALACFDQALRLAPGWPRAHYDRSLALLVLGFLPQGFREYEYRWAANGVPRPGDDDPAMLRRLWRGDHPAGQRILLYAEQGLGDAVQFARYVALLAERGAHVRLEVQPALRPLMRYLRPGCEVGQGGELPPFDTHCPLGTMPLLAHTSLATIPPPAVFTIPHDRLADWQARTASHPGYKVGLVWAGSSANPNDRRRSARFETFLPLVRNQELRSWVRFFSFQVGDCALELQAESNHSAIADLSPFLTDASETAAALQQMDLVITVDTFVAHLAATLAVPTWVLLPFAPDWRWLLERTDSPWYPCLRLFRQQRPGDWESVMHKVLASLNVHAEKHQM